MAYKVTKTTAPAAPSVYKIGTDKLYGIDATTSDDNVSLSRACGISYFAVEQNDGEAMPGIMNMIRTNAGEIGKRCGAEKVKVTESGESTGYIAQVLDTLTWDDYMVRITIDGHAAGYHTKFYYGIHFYKFYDGGYEHTVYNTGIVEENTSVEIYSCNIIGSNVILLLGSCIFSFKIDDPTSVMYIKPGDYGDCSDWIDSGVKVPTVFIGNVPKGGGSKGYEPINLICPWVCERFQGDGTTTEYVLSLKASAGHQPMARVINSDGTVTNPSVNISNDGAKVTFSNAPGKPAVEDNVYIYYALENLNYERICKCTLSCNFGVGGYKDRMFLSGNEAYPNYIWYSAMDDYLYFPETNYITVGDSTCTVSALAGQDTSLAVITKDKCYLVSGSVGADTENDFNPEAVFKISHVFESVPPVDRCKPLVFNNEMVYVSEQGIAAITPSNVMDERYIQLRSERVNYWLLREDLTETVCCVCGDFLVVSNKNGRLYLFDGSQFQSTASKPFSYRQYEAFIWEGIDADYLWSHGDDLYYCSDLDSAIYRIPFTDGTYSDNGQAIPAYFETPNIYGSDFYKKKSFSKLGILLRKLLDSDDKKEIGTSVRVWAKKNNEEWKLIRDYDGSQSLFRYDHLNYLLFTYRPCGKNYSIDKKIKIKKTYSLKLRFENDVNGMPFFLQAFSLEYTK